jgi:hypothetical protein
MRQLLRPLEFADEEQTQVALQLYIILSLTQSTRPW